MPRIYTLITGSSTGIGRDLAKYCASKGRNVLLVALPSSGLEIVNSYVKNTYHIDSHYFETDLSVPDGPESVLNWVKKNNYHVDFLINNAGIAGTSIFEKSTLKYNDERIMVNIRALVLLTHLFLPLLRENKKAYILNVGSLSAFYSIPYKSLYAASKAFVVNFSQALRTELKNSGVSISVVCPNGVRTNLGTNSRIETHGLKGRLTSVSSEQVSKISIEGTLKGKFLIIPGRINFLLLLIGKIIPVFFQQMILLKEFGKEVKVSKIE